MNIVRFGKKMYDAIAAYEQRLDYDSIAYLFDRVRALEREIHVLRLTIPPACANDTKLS